MKLLNRKTASARAAGLITLGKATRETRGVIPGTAPDDELQPTFNGSSLTRD